MPQKNGEITIELEPASLGRIIVRVTYDADRASVALMSANPRTLEILSRDAGSIAGMLEEKPARRQLFTYRSRKPILRNPGGNAGQRTGNKSSKKTEKTAVRVFYTTGQTGAGLIRRKNG